MTTAKISQSIAPQDYSTNSDSSPGEIPLQPFPKWISMVSGQRGEICKRLFYAQVIDPWGRTTPEYSHYPLPDLNADESLFIKEALSTEIKIELGSQIEPYNLTLESLLGLVRAAAVRGGYKVSSFDLMGEYVTHFLFNQTHYPQRVFADLKIGDFYDDRLLASEEAMPNMQFRCQIQKKTPSHVIYDGKYYPNYTLEEFEIKQVERLFLEELSSLIVKERKLCKTTLFKEINCNVFSNPCAKADKNNLFHVVCFKNSPTQLILSSQVARASIFIRDDLYISLLPYLCYQGQFKVRAFYENPLLSFIHFISDSVHTDVFDNLDGDTWLHYLTCKTGGSFTLHKALDKYFLSQMKQQLTLLNEKITNWLTRPHLTNPLTRFLFVLNGCFCLEGIAEISIAEIAAKQLDGLEFQTDKPEEAIAAELHQLVVKNPESLFALKALLQLCSFYIYTRNRPLQKDIGVDLVTEDILSPTPVFQLRLGKKKLALPFQLKEAIEKIKTATQSNLWPQIEGHLFTILLFLLPPSNNIDMEKESCFILNLDFGELKEGAGHLLNEPSPLLQYLGVLLLSGIPEIPSIHTRKMAEIVVSDILTSYPDERIKEQLDILIGPGIIPDLNDEHFEERYIESLFVPERDSLDQAYILWKGVVNRGEGKELSYRLLKNLSRTQPAKALTLFIYLDRSNFFMGVPDESFNRLLSLVLSICDIRKPQQQHTPFMESVGRTICKLLKSHNFDLSNGQKKEASLRRFAKWFTRHGDRRVRDDLLGMVKNEGFLQPALPQPVEVSTPNVEGEKELEIPPLVAAPEPISKREEFYLQFSLSVNKANEKEQTIEQWLEIFKSLTQENEKKIIALFEELEKEGILYFEPSASYLAIYNLYIVALYTHETGKIVRQLQNRTKLQKIAEIKAEPLQVFMVLTDVFNSSYAYAKADPSLMPFVHDLFADIETVWGELEMNYSQKPTENLYYSFKAFTDLSYVGALLWERKKENIQIVNCLVKKIVKKNYGPSYWMICGKVINLLYLQATLPAFDALSDVIEKIKPDDIETEKALVFVVANLNTPRAFIGITLWQRAFASGNEPTSLYWRQGYYCLKHAITSNVSNMDQKSHRMVLTLSNHHEKFIKIPLFNFQYYEIVLLYLGRTRNATIANTLLHHLNKPFSILPLLSQKEGGEEVLQALPLAICNSAHFDITIFNSYTEQFWNKIDTANSKKGQKSKDKIWLPAEKCFNLKKLMIISLLEQLKLEHPEPECFLNLAKSFLTKLKEHPVLGKMKQRIAPISRLCEEAEMSYRKKG